jgi:tyrosinase
MADHFVTRQNFMRQDLSQIRTKFLEGVKILKNTPSGKSTKDFGIPALNGVDSSVSRYDLFVIWHYRTMHRLVPPSNKDERYAAHGSPLFLPWHRIMLLAFEYNLQVALGDAGFALPYWDWVADGSMPDPRTSRLWSNAPDFLGTDRGGGLYYDPNVPGQYAVTLYEDPDDPDHKLRQIPPRGVLRELSSQQDRKLPTTTAVDDAAKATEFDGPRYKRDSTGFRNNLEADLHNLVHVWVGGDRGDMGPSSSPNDPVFFLHHCNVDRIWEAWMQTNNRTYQPNMSESDYPGLRIDDELPVSPDTLPVSPGITIRATLDMTKVFRYDNFVNTGSKPAHPVIGPPGGGIVG